ncbi:MAG TPA: 1,4-alpha-glucan-branching enzyme, partial [Proteobacteria bacterium]|nr:1,4-alpha-glucan-branching enzyme [Pseudomonadota bacterium]
MENSTSSHPGVSDPIKKLLATDPLLQLYETTLHRRAEKTRKRERQLTRGEISLREFAAGQHYFGLHLKDREWVLREWAPNA